MWHIQDSQGQILSMAFTWKSSTSCESFPLGLDALVGCRIHGWGALQGVAGVGLWPGPLRVQGYLTHKKTHPPRTLQYDHA